MFSMSQVIFFIKQLFSKFVLGIAICTTTTVIVLKKEITTNYSSSDIMFKGQIDIKNAAYKLFMYCNDLFVYVKQQ